MHTGIINVEFLAGLPIYEKHVNEDGKMLKSRDALSCPMFYLLKTLRYAFEKQRCYSSVTQARFSLCASVEVLGTFLFPA